MKMKLAEVSVYEDTPDIGKTSIGGSVTISLEMEDGQAGGTFGVTFEHEGAKDLTYRQLEQLVLDKVRSSLNEI